ncbi:hypothetical protein B0T24DRAFT_646168 [Lasiosphaeria ovina]|uniref:Rhodopsin domain-containing protein n=1 Tax=Lasiosphaeria ovina TaxID=92902 RepID=A0AAE0NM80_9PEZI|nr:hypothetical protein B0T24DRAFT_646168 [Lasiosphaeria ovina]
MVQLDNNFTPEQRRQYVVSAAIIGLVLSSVSLVARLWARYVIVKKLRLEDWFMIAGLLLSYGTVGLMFWGQSIWIQQKIQPPTMFLVKTSIILFNARIFVTRKFRIVSWVVWATTLLWMIGTVVGTTLQCSPPSFFWDKRQAGSCAGHTVVTIGLTSAVVSCVGDIAIFIMPIPILARLKIDKRTRAGLISGSVQIAVWTYFEMSIGITCGNLPFLAPLVGCTGPRRRRRTGYLTSNSRAAPYQQPNRDQTRSLSLQQLQSQKPPSQVSLSPIDLRQKPLPLPPAPPGVAADQLDRPPSQHLGGLFTRFYDSPEGSEIELQRTDAGPIQDDKVVKKKKKKK